MSVTHHDRVSEGECDGEGQTLRHGHHEHGDADDQEVNEILPVLSVVPRIIGRGTELLDRPADDESDDSNDGDGSA